MEFGEFIEAGEGEVVCELGVEGFGLFFEPEEDLGSREPARLDQ